MWVILYKLVSLLIWNNHYTFFGLDEPHYTDLHGEVTLDHNDDCAQFLVTTLLAVHIPHIRTIQNQMHIDACNQLCTQDCALQFLHADWQRKLRFQLWHPCIVLLACLLIYCLWQSYVMMASYHWSFKNILFLTWGKLPFRFSLLYRWPWNIDYPVVIVNRYYFLLYVKSVFVLCSHQDWCTPACI